MLKVRAVSYGGTAAIVTNMALVAGMSAATVAKAALVSSLLIVAIADNLTDSLSIHVYQESERLEPHQAFLTTLANFATRLVLSLSFLVIVLFLPSRLALAFSIAWGMMLLGALSWVIGRQRKVSAASEVLKHFSIAIVVIAASNFVGAFIASHIR